MLNTISKVKFYRDMYENDNTAIVSHLIAAGLDDLSLIFDPCICILFFSDKHLIHPIDPAVYPVKQLIGTVDRPFV